MARKEERHGDGSQTGGRRPQTLLTFTDIFVCMHVCMVAHSNSELGGNCSKLVLCRFSGCYSMTCLRVRLNLPEIAQRSGIAGPIQGLQVCEKKNRKGEEKVPSDLSLVRSRGQGVIDDESL